MKWVNISTDTGTHAGLVRGGEVYLTHATDLVDLLPDLDAAAQRAGEAGQVAYEPDRLLPPIARPRKILGIGLNYAAHIEESVSFIKNTAPSVQKWFNKQATAANGPYASVNVPAVSEQLDYEAGSLPSSGKPDATFQRIGRLNWWRDIAVAAITRCAIGNVPARP